MGPIETELRRASQASWHGASGARYEFLSGLAMFSLPPDAQDVIIGQAARLGVSIYTEDAWSEAVEAAEALGL